MPPTTEATIRPDSPITFLFQRRTANLLGFLACAGMLAFGYYLQFVVGLEPCPLCILQRIALFVLGLVFLAAAIHHPRGRVGAWIWGGVIAVVAAIGISIAGRHVWLQHTPEDKRPACGPGLDYLVDTFGPLGSLSRILRGSGECGAVDWTFLSFSIPEWTLAGFVVFFVWALWTAARP
jgi:disulfide bond formation protein DsbB